MRGGPRERGTEAAITVAMMPSEMPMGNFPPYTEFSQTILLESHEDQKDGQAEEQRGEAGGIAGRCGPCRARDQNHQGGRARTPKGSAGQNPRRSQGPAVRR